ncbi:MAG: hypothetical protein SGJ20_04805 [Planctomycetota bacterium]|nr:hypothetical protein [Planctomycetota bacterium]
MKAGNKFLEEAYAERQAAKDRKDQPSRAAQSTAQYGGRGKSAEDDNEPGAARGNAARPRREKRTANPIVSIPASPAGDNPYRTGTPANGDLFASAAVPGGAKAFFKAKVVLGKQHTVKLTICVRR